MDLAVEDNLELRGSLLRHVLDNSGAAVLFCHCDLLAEVAQVVNEAASVRTLAIVGGAAPLARDAGLTVDAVLSFDELLLGAETSLPDVRYDLPAQALGLHAERVTDVDRLPSALAEAIANAPALLDVRTSREVPLPDFTSGLADLRGLQVLAGRDDAERALRNPNEGAAP